MKNQIWKDYLQADEIKPLYPASKDRILFDTVLCWSFILAAIAIASYTGSLIAFILAVVIIVIQQHHLTTFVHEAAHNNIFPGRRRLNDAFSDFIFAGPIFVTTASYRGRHADHHKHLGVAGIDDEINDRYLLSSQYLWKNIFLCLSGIRAAQSFLGHSKSSSQGTTGVHQITSLFCHYAPIFLSNLLLFLWCSIWGNPFMYILLWIVPLATLTMLLVMLRVIVEHQGDIYANEDVEDFEKDITAPVTRTIDPPFWEKIIFGPLNFCYHHEHHLFPAIPYGNLPKLHRLLRERGYYKDHPEYLGNSYIKTLSRRFFTFSSFKQNLSTKSHG